METQPTQTRYDEAIKHYTHAIELKPDFAIAYNNRGITYCDKGEINGPSKILTKQLNYNRIMPMLITIVDLLTVIKGITIGLSQT